MRNKSKSNNNSIQELSYEEQIEENGDKVSISIAGVKPGITQVEASALMDTIIAKDIFLSKGGSLTAKYAAQLTERAVTKFTV